MELRTDTAGGMPLSHHLVLATTNLEEARAHLESVLWPQRVSARSQLAPFRHNCAALGAITLNVLHWGADVVIDAEPGDDAYLVLIMLKGMNLVRQGRRVARLRAGDACVFNPTEPAHLELGAGQCNLTIRVPGAGLRAFAECQWGAATRKLEFRLPSRGGASRPRGLGRLVDLICADLDMADSSLSAATVSRELGRALLSLMLTEFEHNLHGPLTVPGRAAPPRSIRRAADYIHEYARESIALEEIAAAAEISMRSLQEGFRRFLATTPTRYLRDVRLQLAREELARARAAGRTVSDVAGACGFTHLSRFSGQYRRRFGEQPSETLRRGQQC